VFLERQQRDYSILVVQCEDEISSINMPSRGAHGSSRGAATSGPGFALMVEGSASPRSPRRRVQVLVMYQRADRPPACRPGKRQVTSSSRCTPPRATSRTSSCARRPPRVLPGHVLGIHWADRYQMPIIVLSDKKLASVYTTIDKLELKYDQIDRGECSRQRWTDVKAKFGPTRLTDPGHNGNGHKLDLANVKSTCATPSPTTGSPRAAGRVKGVASGRPPTSTIPTATSPRA